MNSVSVENNVIFPSWSASLAAERYDTKSNVKLDGFQSQLQASYVSSSTEELWYNETK